MRMSRSIPFSRTISANDSTIRGFILYAKKKLKMKNCFVRSVSQKASERYYA
jgi:hypothetical protein